MTSADRLVLLAGALVLTRAAAAQDTTRVDSARVDTVHVDSARAADSTADDPGPRLTAGMSFGSLSFVGGRSERATSASVRLRLTSWLSAAVAPSFVMASEPLAAGGTTTRAGLTDLPVELAAGFAPALLLSPSFGLAIAATLPVGDTATGLGAGGPGYAGSLFLAFAPVSWMSVHGGAGRSLTNFSIQGTLDGSAGAWGYAGVGVPLPAGMSLGADYDGDIGAYDPTLGRSTSVAVGLGISAGPLGSVSVNVAHGLTGPTPSWGVALRVGLDYAGLASAGRHAPAQEVVQTFGAGPHGLTSPGNSGNTPAATNGKGKGTGTGTTTTTHGKGRGKHG